MFSQVSVKNSKYGGAEVYTPYADTQWVDIPPRQTPPKQTPPLGRHPMSDTPHETATEAGGMHPTGMHSRVLKVHSEFSLRSTMRIFLS